MKRMMIFSCLLWLCAFAGMAQKFALIDMEYILKNIPAYEMTNEQLSQVSQKWQGEVEALQQEAQNMYKNYQSDLVFLSAEMKTKREEEIVKKEQAGELPLEEKNKLSHRGKALRLMKEELRKIQEV